MGRVQQAPHQQRHSQAAPASRTANNPSTSSRIPQHVCTHNVPYDVCKLRKLHLKGIAAEMEACFEQFAEADGPEMLQDLQKESRRLVEIRNALSEACKEDMDGGSQRTSYGGGGAAHHQLSHQQQAHEHSMTGAMVSSQACHQPPPQPHQMHQMHQMQAPVQIPQVRQYPGSEQGQLKDYNDYNQPPFQHASVDHNRSHQPQMRPSFQQPPIQQQEHNQYHHQQREQHQHSAFGDVAVVQDLPPPALLPSAQPAEFQSNSHDRIDASNDPTWKRTDFEWSQVCRLTRSLSLASP